MASSLELLITDVRPREFVAALGPGTVALPLTVDPQLWVVPVTDDLSMVTDFSDVAVGFELLTLGLAERIATMSTTGRVLYLHVEFHAGLGLHAVAGWQHGNVELGPLFTANSKDQMLHDGYTLVPSHERSEMAVNVGLRFLGVSADGAADEFAAVGLDSYEWTAEWAAAARPPGE